MFNIIHPSRLTVTVNLRSFHVSAQFWSTKSVMHRLHSIIIESMKEIITVCVGQCGIRSAAGLFSLIEKEHRLEADNDSC